MKTTYAIVSCPLRSQTVRQFHVPIDTTRPAHSRRSGRKRFIPHGYEESHPARVADDLDMAVLDRIGFEAAALRLCDTCGDC